MDCPNDGTWMTVYKPTGDYPPYFLKCSKCALILPLEPPSTSRYFDWWDY